MEPSINILLEGIGLLDLTHGFSKMEERAVIATLVIVTTMVKTK